MVFTVAVKVRESYGGMSADREALQYYIRMGLQLFRPIDRIKRRKHCGNNYCNNVQEIFCALNILEHVTSINLTCTFKLFAKEIIPSSSKWKKRGAYTNMDMHFGKHSQGKILLSPEEK